MRKNYSLLLVSVFVLSVSVLCISFARIREVKPTIAEVTNYPTIVIDAGHGGIDGGAEANNVIEKHINLAISLTLRDIFEANGFNVVMTRDTDTSIHDETAKSTRAKKTSDLKNRLKLVNAQSNAIFISIHQNKFSQKSSSGTQVFYSPNNPQSEVLGARLQEKFVAFLQPQNHRQIKKAQKNLYLMYQAKCPSVLVECGFVSNPAEAAKLLDAKYQNQIAFTTFCGVMEFIRASGD